MSALGHPLTEPNTPGQASWVSSPKPSWSASGSTTAETSARAPEAGGGKRARFVVGKIAHPREQRGLSRRHKAAFDTAGRFGGEADDRPAGRRDAHRKGVDR